jgi:hypothetical protein
MIDGQQRVTALMTAILGIEVIDSDFERRRIKISFNPLATGDEEKFKVQDNAIVKDKKWIADIADVFGSEFKRGGFVSAYCVANPEMDVERLHNILDDLIAIKNRQIGVITLNKELTLDEVTDIFVRINSEGATLNQSDFVMSKIAANESYGGNVLRKAIDYFSHLAVKPEWYSDMIKDKSFMETEFASKIKWLRDDANDIFDPEYHDILRVAFMYKFSRGKMKDLVSLLGGRDFEARDYKEEIAEESFGKLKDGVLAFMNEISFMNFILAIKSAGFISKKFINSQMTLNFAYTLYLILNGDNRVDKTQIKRYVSKWYVFTTITSRYIGSPESSMDLDIRRILESGISKYFKEMEDAELSNAFWDVGLVQKLETTASNSPFFNVFLAAQVCLSDDALMTTGTKVSDLVTIIGDVHHIFPKKYLQKSGITEKSKYNQIANYVYLDAAINKSIGEKAPCEYFGVLFEQCQTKTLKYGNITDNGVLEKNLKANCIPEGIKDVEASGYEVFLSERRKLMARKIRDYYYSL